VVDSLEEEELEGEELEELFEEFELELELLEVPVVELPESCPFTLEHAPRNRDKALTPEMAKNLRLEMNAIFNLLRSSHVNACFKNMCLRSFSYIKY